MLTANIIYAIVAVTFLDKIGWNQRRLNINY